MSDDDLEVVSKLFLVGNLLVDVLWLLRLLVRGLPRRINFPLL